MRVFKFLLGSVILGVTFISFSFINNILRSSSVNAEFNEPKALSQTSKIAEIKTPLGYDRVSLKDDSFGTYLRNIKIKKGKKTVHLYNGVKKPFQGAQYLILDIDTGKKDLQQCADAAMRLWAEHLFSQKKYKKIHFNFLSDGKPRFYVQYSKNDRSYETFRKYMDWIFQYANTASLYHELKTIQRKYLSLGDVFIQKGRPFGHAVIVVDMAKHRSTGEKIFLIAQSFMPAQEIHVLKNYNSQSLNPWYSLDFGDSLKTPEYVFSKNKKYLIKRFSAK
jgi:hypothetical protein